MVADCGILDERPSEEFSALCVGPTPNADQNRLPLSSPATVTVTSSLILRKGFILLASFLRSFFSGHVERPCLLRSAISSSSSPPVISAIVVSATFDMPLLTSFAYQSLDCLGHWPAILSAIQIAGFIKSVVRSFGTSPKVSSPSSSVWKVLLLFSSLPPSSISSLLFFYSSTSWSRAAATVLVVEEMGRGKIEIKRIENSTNRQVTFSKRRNGIIKKAREISILCEAQVSVVIFSSSGKMSEYCSPSTTLPKVLERYQTNSGEKLWDAKHESLSVEIERVKKENDNMQIELRHLKGEDLNSLYPKELIPIEEALQIGLTSEKLLEEENKQLTYMLVIFKCYTCFLIYKHHQQLAMDGSVQGLELGYKDREFAPQMTMAFRVQPIQPNLHESK
ncbi:hypothetical protein ZIOFF_019796 [Zingiber officinale]|uniref:Uncharacterized protein n=1 Tax=Zingiber officinale TaxID=94328 RepID=A0A8J5H7G6_ZINOF|nr:hypothetical protein ZIOFF_019796 [Zingiber officinale]